MTLLQKPSDSDKLLSKPTQTGEGCQLQQQTNTENGPRHVLPAAILNHRCKIGISEWILSAARLKMTLERQFFRGCVNKSFTVLLLGGKNLWCSGLQIGIWKRQSGKQTHVYPLIALRLEGLSLSVRVVKITHACYVTSTVIYVNIKHADETGLLEHSCGATGRKHHHTTVSHSTPHLWKSPELWSARLLGIMSRSLWGHQGSGKERRGEEGGGVGMEEALTFLNVTTISLNTDVP